MCGPGAPRGRRWCAAAGLEVKPESSSRLGKDPTSGSCLAVRERGRERGRTGPLGRGGEATRLAGLGHVRNKKEGGERVGWLGYERKKREKGGREGNGPEQKRKRGRKRNASKCI
jgi:hypothetical protein